MDAGLPFASRADRVRLLYRLPLSGHETRLLVLAARGDTTASFDDRQAGVQCQFIEPHFGTSQAASAFDAVALPDMLRTPVSPTELLRAAYSALRPGGIVVGHLDHVMSLHVLLQLRHRSVTLPPWRHMRGFASAPNCLAALARAGFVTPECYYVEPRIQDPMVLVPADPLAARGHFQRSIRRSRALYSTLGYAFRMGLATLRMGGALQPHLFFWARKPC